MVLVLSGVGKIQASLATTLLCERYMPQWLINIGIAGNLKGNQAEIGEVFLMREVRQHDLYLPFEGEHLAYAKEAMVLPEWRMPEQERDFVLQYGGIAVTGDQFVDDEQKVQLLFEQTGADVVEMEAFAFASVARAFGKLQNTIIIKAISDGADDQAKLAHMDNLDFAMRNSIVILQEILEHIVQD
ncbi:MAG: 5'-methylthioadenosine/S-adenosylhomocysteine nucleosidase [bacterium]|nr:5'-methylthioadenosine/S-adenosylhomocysteine nucleosidase [bacterium]